MKTSPLKLITIVGEEVLKETIVRHVLDLGATGASYHSIEGVGSRNARHDDVFSENFQMKVVCKPDVAETILKAIAEEYFDRYAIIAWESDVNVLNGEMY